MESKLINEYGAALTPAMEALDDAMRPSLAALETWAMSIPEMNGQDWAIIRTYVMANYRDMHIYDRYDEHGKTRPYRAAVDAWIMTANELADQVHERYYEWGVKYGNGLDEWEYAFAWQYAYGTLESVCAQIQIKKAMLQRKAIK